jgi:hypothetical protein
VIAWDHFHRATSDIGQERTTIPGSDQTIGIYPPNGPSSTLSGCAANSDTNWLAMRCGSGCTEVGSRPRRRSRWRSAKVCRTRPYDRGWFLEPTIFADLDNNATVSREEIFGPVLSLIPYSDEQQAVAIANDSVYGLGGGVWSGRSRAR